MRYVEFPSENNTKAPCVVLGTKTNELLVESSLKPEVVDWLNKFIGYSDYDLDKHENMGPYLVFAHPQQALFFKKTWAS